MAQDALVFAGTYTRKDSKGIYVLRFDGKTGALSPVSEVESDNPSFLALHPTRPLLYAANENKDGEVSAFSYAADGTLTFLNKVSSHGAAPCHLVVDATGQYVLVANYSSGTVSVYPLSEDGALKGASDIIQQEGSSVNERRQEGPHAHSINLSPNNRFAYSPDLGADKVFIYAFSTEKGKLHAADPASVDAHTPGAGPRHFDFHPNGKYAYGINELDSTVTAFAYDSDSGALSHIHTLSTLPEGYDERTTCADVHVHPNGKFVYGSNRGHDSIAVFSLADDGRMTSLGQESTRGKNPRNFGIDPSGEFLLAANQDTDNVVTFRIDPDKGTLTELSQVEVPTCVCLKFLPLS